MKKISVIIPVYNTQNELFRCLDSIVGQTYKNLEIICIDDGSTDNSGKIADEAAVNDNRIKVVHKTNKGESNARNMGLKMASGDYIAFCDCDDWLDKDMYQIMVSELERENLDMVAAGWYRETNSKSIEITNERYVSDESFGREELLKYLYMRDSYRGFAYIWNKLYKREILEHKDRSMILFDETLQLGGDVLYLAEAALNVKKAKYIDRAFYHYYQREESGSHTKDVKKLRDWVRAYERVLEIFEREQIDEMVIQYVRRFLAYHSSNAAEIAIGQNLKQEKIEFQNFMQKYKQEYLSLNTEYPERIARYQNLLNQ